MVSWLRSRRSQLPLPYGRPPFPVPNFVLLNCCPMATFPRLRPPHLPRSHSCRRTILSQLPRLQLQSGNSHYEPGHFLRALPRRCQTAPCHPRQGLHHQSQKAPTPGARQHLCPMPPYRCRPRRQISYRQHHLYTWQKAFRFFCPLRLGSTRIQHHRCHQPLRKARHQPLQNHHW